MSFLIEAVYAIMGIAIGFGPLVYFMAKNGGF